MLKIENRGCHGNGSEKLKKICAFVHLSTEVKNGQNFKKIYFFYFQLTGGKPRNYHEIVLTLFCSQATSGTRRGSFQAENWKKKGWCHFYFCFILQLRTNDGEIRQCGSV